LRILNERAAEKIKETTIRVSTSKKINTKVQSTLLNDNRTPNHQWTLSMRGKREQEHRYCYRNGDTNLRTIRTVTKKKSDETVTGIK
jgi:hypothetical protein